MCYMRGNEVYKIEGTLREEYFASDDFVYLCDCGTHQMEGCLILLSQHFSLQMNVISLIM